MSWFERMALGWDWQRRCDICVMPISHRCWRAVMRCDGREGRARRVMSMFWRGWISRGCHGMGLEFWRWVMPA